jgi:hypothetical protein
MEQVLGLADETLGGTDRVWDIPRRREKRMLTTLVHHEKRKDRTDGLQGWVGGRAYSSRTRWLRLFGNSRANLVAIQQQHDYSGRTEVLQRCRSDESA